MKTISDRAAPSFTQTLSEAQYSEGTAFRNTGDLLSSSFHFVEQYTYISTYLQFIRFSTRMRREHVESVFYALVNWHPISSPDL